MAHTVEDPCVAYIIKILLIIHQALVDSMNDLGLITRIAKIVELLSYLEEFTDQLRQNPVKVSHRGPW